jgi:hypothetical protein
MPLDNMKVAAKNHKVIIDCGEEVRYLTMEACSARKFAVFIMEMANVADSHEPFIRVSGECVCEVCGDKYWRHPHDMKQLDSNGEPFLKVRCDGRRLKL